MSRPVSLTSAFFDLAILSPWEVVIFNFYDFPWNVPTGFGFGHFVSCYAFTIADMLSRKMWP